MRFLVILIAFLAVACNSGNQTTVTPTTDEIVFKGLTFQSSRCNGTCPEISMNLYEDRRVEISRGIYINKGDVDSTKSGNFIGALSEKEFETVAKLWRAIAWDSTAFPDVQCCDAPVVALKFTYKDKPLQFKSMTPPPSTKELINYLTSLGSTVVLPRHDKPFDFEVIE